MVRHPKLSSTVMLATVGVVVATHNLALGVGVGVVLSGLFFALFTIETVRSEHMIAAAPAARTITSSTSRTSSTAWTPGSVHAPTSRSATTP